MINIFQNRKNSDLQLISLALLLMIVLRLWWANPNHATI